MVEYYGLEILGEEYEFHRPTLKEAMDEIRFRKAMKRNPRLSDLINRMD